MDEYKDMKDFEEVYNIKLFPQIHGNDPEQTNGLIETYGEELNFIDEFIKQHPGNIKHVWTVVEDDNNNLLVCAGFHIVNRLNYIISTEPWKEESEVYIWCIFENDYDEEEE